MGFQTKPIVIDGKGHLLGRLATVVAKHLLMGQKIVIVRCEDICISVKYLDFLRKGCNVKPTHGPFHYRAPGKIFWRVVRGMVPHKTYRGKHALEKLRCYEGIPSPYDTQKRKVVPCAMRHLCLRARRKFCTVGRLSAEMGWKYQSVVARLEEKRKVKSASYYERKKLVNKLKKKAITTASKKIAPYQKIIESYGFE